MAPLARRSIVLVLTATLGLGASGCGAGGFADHHPHGSGTAPASRPGPATVNLLVSASSPSEPAAVRKAADAWAAASGNRVRVRTSRRLDADLLRRELAGPTPPDVFYVDPGGVSALARNGSLYPYGDRISGARYIDTLRKTFTYDGKFYCAPKDFSTLALVVDEERWQRAGLTEQDLPQDWAGLEAAAKRLTSPGVAGLVTSPSRDRIGVFMRQAGGWWVAEDGHTMTANSPQNVAALTQVRKMLDAGTLRFSNDVGARWGGEALLRGKAAMTIEGNWIRGALKNQPNRRFRVVELPGGPAGRGTLSFTNCWGIAARSANQDAAIDLVSFLGRDDQQLAAADAFGVMPATQSAMGRYSTVRPDDVAFAAGARYAQGPVNDARLEPVLTRFDRRLARLRSTDPRTLLDEVQHDGEAALSR